MATFNLKIVFKIVLTQNKTSLAWKKRFFQIQKIGNCGLCSVLYKDYNKLKTYDKILDT